MVQKWKNASTKSELMVLWEGRTRNETTVLENLELDAVGEPLGLALLPYEDGTPAPTYVEPVVEEMVSEDEEDAPAPSSAIGREGARADTQQRFDTVVANQQKRPVREQLCPGPRSEEDLLKEQVLDVAMLRRTKVERASDVALPALAVLF